MLASRAVAASGHMFGLGREVRLGFVAFAALLVLGTLGFWLVGDESWTVFDAFFMTVTTVTTVGYSEVHPLDTPGRIVSLLVIFFGVGIVLFVAASTAEAILAGAFFRRRHVEQAIRKLSGHVIVCGYGRVGRAICRELDDLGVPYVIIDRLEVEAGGAPVLQGDATDDEVLRTAGIERCRGLVSVLESDAENIYTVLAARSMRSDAVIVARCSQERSRSKLMAAGANRVINPYLRGGQLLARILMRPQAAEFIEEVSAAGGLDVLIGEAVVTPGCPFAGSELRESGIRQQLDIIVTSMVKADGRRIFNPAPTERIEPGDQLVVLGRSSAIERLGRMAAGESR